MRIQLHHIVPLALLWLGCGAETPVSEASPTETAALAQELSMLQLSDTQSLLGSVAEVAGAGDFERQQVVGDVYHYSLQLRVGQGQHDVITLHRVVRERAPFRPVRGRESVFMVHGDAWNFTGAFMASTLTQDVPVDHSIAVYLAQRGVDVWGIDLRWTHVPLGTQDFDFMKTWNIGTHAKDIGTGLAVARRVRELTGSGGGRMNLLGWSRGALLGYAYLNAETLRPAAQRHVSGFIPVDMVVHFGKDAEQQRKWACDRAAVAEAAWEQGRAEGGLLGPGAGVPVMMLGQAAIHMPTGIAMPPMPPLPYDQLATLMGAATFQFLGTNPAVPFYHFTAGQFDASPLPTGLKYVRSRQFFDLLSNARPYQSFREIVESEQLMCGQDLPYDDHLAQVKVPTLYVGAGGGFGEYGLTTLNKLGGKDKSSLIVKRMPDQARIVDYGHADLFLGHDADSAVWAPIHEWMKRH
jgi:hypothetical protein